MITFTDGEALLAAELNTVTQATIQQVANDTARNALPISVKSCWQNGVLYKRDSTNAWKAIATSEDVVAAANTVQLWAKNYTDTGLANKADSTHTHSQAQVTGLTAALDGKVDGNYTIKAGRTPSSFTIGADESTGLIYVNHGLGSTPSIALVGADGDNGDCTVFASVDSKTSTQLICHMRNIGNTESSVWLNWVVFK